VTQAPERLESPLFTGGDADFLDMDLELASAMGNQAMVDAIANKSAHAAAPPPGPPPTDGSTRSGGRRTAPLPHRGELEEAYGQSFGGVQIVFGDDVDEAGEAIGAEAFTDGTEIAVPGGTPSKELLAHELAHVAQVRRKGAGSAIPGSASRPGQASEREADQAASVVAGGGEYRVQEQPGGDLQGSWLSAFSDALESAGSAVGSTVGEVVDAFSGDDEEQQAQAETEQEDEGGWLSDVVSGASKTVGDWGDSALEVASSVGSSVVSKGEELFDDAVEVSSTISAGVEAGGSWLTEVVSSAPETISDLSESALEVASTVGSGIVSTGAEVIEGVVEVTEAVDSGLADVASSAGGAVVDTVQQIIEDPSDLDALASTIWSSAGDVVEAAGDAVSDVSSEVVEAGTEIASEAVETIAAVDESIVEPVVGFVQAQIDEILEKADDVGEEMASELAEDKQTGTTEGIELDDAQYYAHGGFMGMADELLADPIWAAYLKSYTPEDYLAIVRIIHESSGHSGAKELIGWEYELSGSLMTELENNPVIAAYGQWMTWQEQASSGEDLQAVTVEMDVWLDPEHPDDLSLARVEHGDTITTVAENTIGWTDPLGEIADGLTVDEWTQIYSELLSISPDAAYATSSDDLSTESIQDIENIAAESSDTISVFLDIKSADSDSTDVQEFVDALEDANLDVEGVGSFREEQLQGIEDSVLFYHKLDDVSADQDSLADGDQVMFNLGSLVDYSSGTWQYDDKAIKDLYDLASSTDPDLVLGGYVQESDLSPEAYELIAGLVVDTDWLELGFAYGSVDGTVSTGTSGSGQGAQAVT